MFYVHYCDIETKEGTRHLQLNRILKGTYELEQLRAEIRLKYKAKNVFFRYTTGDKFDEEIKNPIKITNEPIKPLNAKIKIEVKPLKIK